MMAYQNPDSDEEMRSLKKFLYRTPYLALFILLVFAIFLIPNKGIWKSFGIIFEVLFFGSVFICFLKFLYGRITGGPLLVDVGSGPLAKLFFFAIISLLLILVPDVWTAILSGGLERLLSRDFLYHSTLLLFNLLLFTGRIQIRQNGIWNYTELIRWDDLEAFYWDPDVPSVLVFRLRSRSGSSSGREVRIRVENEYQIDNFLKRAFPRLHDTTAEQTSYINDGFISITGKTSSQYSSGYYPRDVKKS